MSSKRAQWILCIAAVLALAATGCVAKRLASHAKDAPTIVPRPTADCQKVLERPTPFQAAAVTSQTTQRDLRDFVLHYACASQEYNFEKGFRSGRADLPSFRSPPLKTMAGLFDFPYWDINLREQPRLSTREFGHPFFCLNRTEGKCSQVRIYANPHDTLHVKVLKQAFGAPTGLVAGIMTSSIRTVLLMPPSESPFFLKLPGQVLLQSPAKALTTTEIMASVLQSHRLGKSMPEVFPESSGLSLSASFFLPATATFRDLDLEKHFGDYPEDRFPRQYSMLKRDLPDLKALIKDHSGVLLLPGHSLLSEGFMNSALGRSLVGPTQGERFAWARQWVWPSVAQFIVSSIFDHGMHFETHFQNMDFLLLFDQTNRLQQLVVLMKDLGDAWSDPLIPIALGNPVKEPFVAALSWPPSTTTPAQTLIARKYAGKFGMLSPSRIFDHNADLPEWALALRAELAAAFSAQTRKEGFAAEDLIKEASLHGLIYGAQQPGASHQQQLGDVVAAMRALVLRASLQRKTTWATESNLAKKEVLVRSYLQAPAPVAGMESDCKLPRVFHQNFSQEVDTFRYGTTKSSGGMTIEMEVMAKFGAGNSLGCYLVRYPIRTMDLESAHEAAFGSVSNLP